ncbi:MAG: TetR/AcrR family transcriptional regulator [Treponema sp.]|jgi:AcrR family transcriptional regulator|nr:TetR/AcrR family transcriptional regulator [Treponema sp.]
MKNYSWLKNIFGEDAESMTDKQKAVIKAAVELFSEKGYASTSTKEIAVRAGVAEGTIFKQYPTKKDLMLWITERIIQKALFPLISSGLSELLAKNYNSSEEFLSVFFQNRLSLIQDDIPLFRIIIQEIHFQPDIRRMLVEQFKKLPLPAVAEKLSQGKKSANFSETEVLNILLSCIAGFFVLRFMIMPEFFPKKHLQKDAETFLRFFKQGLNIQGDSI